MAFLTLGGTDVQVASSSQSVMFIGGEDGRCYNGALLRNQRNRKREWKLSSVPLAQSASATLQALLATASLAMTGTIETGTVSVRPEVYSVGQTLGAGGAVLEVVSFTLREI